MNNILRKAILVCCLLVTVSGAAEYMYHIQFRISPGWETFYREQAQELKDAGYTSLVILFQANRINYLSASNDVGIDYSDFQRTAIKSLLDDIRNIGLAVYPEIKLMGKTDKTFGTYLRNNRYPGMVVDGGHAGFINPEYTLPGGKDVYDGLVMPLIDEMIYLTGCDSGYFFMGGDEVDKMALDTIANRTGSTQSQVYADACNRMADTLIARGLTPVIWGDMMLSEKLVNSGVVTGFDGDDRFTWFTQMNGNSNYFGKGDMSDLAGLLTNRDKMVAADWHYFSSTPEGEYPSIDFFRTMGFKEVWIGTWYDRINMARYSKQARAGGVTGYIATTWHIPSLPHLQVLEKTIIHNSIYYFKNAGTKPAVTADIEPAAANGLRITGLPAGGMVKIVFRHPYLGALAGAAAFLLKEHGNPVSWTGQAIVEEFNFTSGRAFIGDFTIPAGKAVGTVYDLVLRAHDTDGYYVNDYFYGAFRITSDTAYVPGDTVFVPGDTVTTGMAPQIRDRKSGLRVWPNPMGRQLNIEAETPHRGVSTVNVYNWGGMFVRTVQIQWDGTDHAGHAVPPGIYYVSDGRSVARVIKRDP